MTRASDLRWGVAHGLGFAAFCSLWVTILMLVRDSIPFTRLGRSYLGAIVLYYVGGIAAGLVMGLLRPLARSKVGKLCTIFLFPPIIALGICLVIFGSPSQWAAGALLTLVAWSAIMGTGVVLDAGS
jgi:hypothetical protein